MFIVFRKNCLIIWWLTNNQLLSFSKLIRSGCILVYKTHFFIIQLVQSMDKTPIVQLMYLFVTVEASFCHGIKE